VVVEYLGLKGVVYQTIKINVGLEKPLIVYIDFNTRMTKGLVAYINFTLDTPNSALYSTPFPI